MKFYKALCHFIVLIFILYLLFLPFFFFFLTPPATFLDEGHTLPFNLHVTPTDVLLIGMGQCI